MNHFTAEYSSPIGKLVLASDGDSITGLWMEGQRYFGSTLEEGAEERKLPVHEQAFTWLDHYFKGENPVIDFNLAPKGTEFRQKVWQKLREIPYGEVTTYGQIAHKLAHEAGKDAMSARAVGGAVGKNPISIIIPCHRVVGSDGSLTGFAGGIAKKIHLLELEEVDMSAFSIPTRGTAL